MDKFLLQCSKERLDLEHPGSRDPSVSAWLGHADLDFFNGIECFVDLSDSLLLLSAVQLVLLVGEHSFFHFMRVKYIGPKWIFNLASVGVNLIVENELGRNDDLLAQLQFLLLFKGIVGFLVAENVLELLAHLVLKFFGTHASLGLFVLVHFPVNQVDIHADVVVSIYLVGLMLLLKHLDAAVLVLEHVVEFALGVVVHVPEELWFDRNVRQTVLQLVLRLELVPGERRGRLLRELLVVLNSAFEKWVSEIDTLA